MRNKVAELESRLKVAESELERLKSRPAEPFSQREELLLGQIDLINRQLQGWISGVLLTSSCFRCSKCRVLMQM